MSEILRVEELKKTYGDLIAIDDVSFTVEEGEFLTILGPSGCGKSTTLHILAGLINPTEGSVSIHGEDITYKPPNKRDIGLVFQKTALFPHMNVFDNVAYGLRLQGEPKESINERVTDLLQLVELEGHSDHLPSELSGGQRQRISLIRALAPEPEILLLDEPLTGLDRVLRENLRSEIKRIQRQLDITSIYVTHDQEEALSMSDNILVLDDGEIQQIGSPKEVYKSPKNKTVAEFVGKSTRFSGVFRNGSKKYVESDHGNLYVNDSLKDGQKVDVFIKPEDIILHTYTDDDNYTFSGKVLEKRDLGSYSEVIVELNSDKEVLTITDGFPEISIGKDVYLTYDKEDAIVL